MLNALQILAFIPMMTSRIPLRLEATMKGFLDFGYVPNVFEYALDDSEFIGNEPYKLASDFGFENSVFLINGGEVIS